MKAKTEQAESIDIPCRLGVGISRYYMFAPNRNRPFTLFYNFGEPIRGHVDLSSIDCQQLADDLFMQGFVPSVKLLSRSWQAALRLILRVLR
jgi:hypothetical protein